MTEGAREGYAGEEDVVVVEPARAGAGGGGGHSLLLLCDHASYRIPKELGEGFGGVPEGILLDHYGWDIGALGIARVVARELGVGLVRSNFSRLVIDPNRGLEAGDLIRQDLGIEMNAEIGDEERARRIALFYEPYHRAIDAVLDADGDAGGEILGVIAVHTFTPSLGGVWRKWDTGLIYDVGRGDDIDCARFLMEFLRSEGFCVGDNEPYPPLAGDSLGCHGGGRGLVGVGIEVRNDLVRVGIMQEEWGRRLARGLAGWLES